jgi:mannosylglycerate hydrolase
LGDDTYDGLFGIEDAIDRGDSYDCDPDPVRELDLRGPVTVERTRHESGIERLRVVRDLADLGPLTVEACVAPGVTFVRCRIELDNRAPDHRLRLRFPTGSAVETFAVSTTFDTVRRSTAPIDDAGWFHPAPRTFPHQGWIAANGLVVGAPGLPEAEVTPAGEVLVTLVRSVGALARITLRTRPMPAGPEMSAPGAQTQGLIAATITLARNVADARAAEIGLRGALGGDTPILAPDEPLLELAARNCVLSACKPAQDGERVVVRVLNPSDDEEEVHLNFGLDVRRARPVGLDEQPVEDLVTHRGRVVGMYVPPHALRSVRVTFG